MILELEKRCVSNYYLLINPFSYILQFHFYRIVFIKSKILFLMKIWRMYSNMRVNPKKELEKRGIDIKYNYLKLLNIANNLSSCFSQINFSFATFNSLVKSFFKTCLI